MTITHQAKYDISLINWLKKRIEKNSPRDSAVKDQLVALKNELTANYNESQFQQYAEFHNQEMNKMFQ